MVDRTVVCAALEILDADDAIAERVVNVVRDSLVSAGGRPLGDGGLEHAFDDCAVAVEAAIVAQWDAQRLDGGEGVKVRLGIHVGPDGASASAGAAALCEAANGNQIVASAAVDAATGSMLDARPMGTHDVPGVGVGQLWLLTDSRPHVDARPLRLPEA